MNKEQENQFKENIKEIARLELKNSFTDNLMETLNSAFIFKYVDTLEKQNKKYKEVIDKAIDKLQLLIDIGFDYDGFNQADSLKTLIDELVGYAKESRKILKEVEETDINVGEVE